MFGAIVPVCPVTLMELAADIARSAACSGLLAFPTVLHLATPPLTCQPPSASQRWRRLTHRTAPLPRARALGAGDWQLGPALGERYPRSRCCHWFRTLPQAARSAVTHARVVGKLRRRAGGARMKVAIGLGDCRSTADRVNGNISPLRGTPANSSSSAAPPHPASTHCALCTSPTHSHRSFCIATSALLRERGRQKGNATRLLFSSFIYTKG